jgi:hypothetical protein|tara:strand:+ start:48 stop:863 length:816 start_codon:yes stop_codon:yes gene_type:complete
MRKRKPISYNDWLRRKVIPKFLETGIIPTQKHHTIPKHHGGKDSPLIEVTIKEHAEIHLEYGKKHNCKRCIDQYPKLMGLWNTFIDEVEKFKGNELTKNYDDYLDLTDEKLRVSENDIMFKERVELDENINYEDNWKGQADSEFIEDSIREDIFSAIDDAYWFRKKYSGMRDWSKISVWGSRGGVDVWKTIVDMYYGINEPYKSEWYKDKELTPYMKSTGLTFETIAKELNCSDSRVREVLSGLLRRLKNRDNMLKNIDKKKLLKPLLNYF